MKTKTKTTRRELARPEARELAELPRRRDEIRAGERARSRGDGRAGGGSGRAGGRRRAASGRTWTFIFLYAAMSLMVVGASGRI